MGADGFLKRTHPAPSMLWRILYLQTCCRVKEEFAVLAIREAKQVVQATSESIKRLIADETQVPVILNEAQDRTLIGN